MSEEQKQALRITIDYLDNLMQETPSRELADVSNYLDDVSNYLEGLLAE